MTGQRGAYEAELTKLRSSGQASKPFLLFRRPSTIFSCQMDPDNMPVSNDKVIEVRYVSGVGTRTNVKAGMTAYVGSVAGGRDLGLVRMRRVPSANTLYVGYESEIDWRNQLSRASGNVYITVVNDMNLWNKQFKLIDGLAYFDGDIAYSDQHTKFDPLVRMGPMVRVFKRTGTNVSYTWPASGSYVIDGSSISSYEWSAPGSVTSSNMDTDSPTIAWNADGQYMVYCTVVTEDGKTTTASRVVYIYSNTNPPERNFQITQSPRATVDGGGFNFEVELYANADSSYIYDKTQVVLFAEEYYNDGVAGSIGTYSGCENQICVGWIVGESIVWDHTQGTVKFQVAGAQEWLKQMTGMPVGIEWVNTVATAWTNMYRLTPKLFLWHALHWRCTFDTIADVYMPLYNPQFAGLDALTNSTWAQLLQCARDKILADPFVDNLGSMYLRVKPAYVPANDRSTWPTVMEIQKGDWEGEMDITVRSTPTASRVELSGVLITPGSDPTALFSLAPGHIYKRHGIVIPADYLSLSSQSQANILAGSILAYNNKLYDFDFTLAMNNRLLNIYDYHYIYLDIAAEDNIRGITYQGNAIITEIEYSYDAKAGCFYTKVRAEQETFSDINSDGDIPPNPPPPEPPIPPLPPPPEPGPGPVPILKNYAVVLIAGSGFYYTADIDAETPVWFEMNSGLEGTSGIFSGLGIDAGGQVITLVSDVALANRFFVAPTIGDAWLPSFDGLDLDYFSPGPDGGRDSDGKIAGWGWDPTLPDLLLIQSFSNNYDIYHTRLSFKGMGSFWSVALDKSTGAINHLSNWDPAVGYKLGADGTWVMTAREWDAGGGYLGVIVAGSDGFPGNFVTLVYIPGMQSTVLNQTMIPIDGVILRAYPPAVSPDNGATWNQPEDGPIPFSTNYETEACAVNADASYAMVGTYTPDPAVEHGLYVSSDGGGSYLPNMLLLGSVSCVQWIKKEENKDFWGVCQIGKIWLTDDYGVSFKEKTGNLADLVPGFTVVALRVVPQ